MSKFLLNLFQYKQIKGGSPNSHMVKIFSQPYITPPPPLRHFVLLWTWEPCDIIDPPPIEEIYELAQIDQPGLRQRADD